MPRAERPAPPYIQIQDHYRTAILDGTIAAGERLPSIADIAREWEVSPTTAAKAIGTLQAENLVRSTTQGTFATPDRGTLAGHGQLDAIRRGARLPNGHRYEVTEGGLVAAPKYVAELLGMDPAGAMVARRQWITYDVDKPIRLSVSWWDAALAEVVPQLATREDGDSLAWIEAATGRRPVDGRDDFEARDADLREARALGIRPGDTVLAGVHRWWDEKGMIEYGEWVIPARRVVGFSYTIA